MAVVPIDRISGNERAGGLAMVPSSRGKIRCVDFSEQ
jgi:hypothetical protein